MASNTLRRPSPARRRSHDEDYYEMRDRLEREAKIERLLAQAERPRMSLGGVLFYVVVFAAIAFMLVVGTAERLGYPLTSFLPGYAAPAPTVQPVAPPSAPAPAQAAPQPAEQAPAAPIDAAPAVEAPAPVQSVPTAAVIQAAPAPAVVVPHAPARIAPESAPAPEAPTVATTAPMVAGKDFAAPSKTCVETQRDGATVHFEQLQDLTPAEMSSVADYLRTGMIAGEAGPCAQ